MALNLAILIYYLLILFQTPQTPCCPLSTYLHKQNRSVFFYYLQELETEIWTIKMWDTLFPHEHAGVCVYVCPCHSAGKPDLKKGTGALPPFCQHSASLLGFTVSTWDTHWADASFASQQLKQHVIASLCVQADCSHYVRLSKTCLWANAPHFLLKMLNYKYSSNNEWGSVKTLLPQTEIHGLSEWWWKRKRNHKLKLNKACGCAQ